MFGEIFRFELRYQLRQPIFWLGCAVFFLLTFLATATDAVTIGGGSGQVHRNAAWVVMQMHLMMSLLGMFFVAAFVASSVVRDAQHRTEELFFTLPIRRGDYLLGRFSGALVAAILTGVPVSLGLAAGSLMPWLEPDRLGPFAPSVYLFSLVALYAPNVILVSCALFAVATPTRSLLLTYAGVVGILVAYSVAGALAADITNARAATLLDPLGIGAFEIATRYWTVLDRNLRLLSLDGPFLASRALWLGAALALLAVTYWRFSFTLAGTARRRRFGLGRRAAAVAIDAASATAVADRAASSATDRAASPGAACATAPGADRAAAAVAAVPQVFTRATTLRQLLRQARLEISLVLRSLAFPVIVAF